MRTLAPLPSTTLSRIRRTFRSPVVTLDLCHMQWRGASRSALPPHGARSQWSTLCFLTTSSTHSLSASRLSRPHTTQANSMLPSRTTNSLLRSLCHESAPPVFPLQGLFPICGVIFCSLSSTSSCASLWFRQLGSPDGRSCHQARRWPHFS